MKKSGKRPILFGLIKLAVIAGVCFAVTYHYQNKEIMPMTIKAMSAKLDKVVDAQPVEWKRESTWFHIAVYNGRPTFSYSTDIKYNGAEYKLDEKSDSISGLYELVANRAAFFSNAILHPRNQQDSDNDLIIDNDQIQ